MAYRVVLCGTFRKDPTGLRQAFDELRDFGCEILSPKNLDFSRERDGFVYLIGEEADVPARIERRHLDAIQQANFVWFYAPEGYIGTTGALELGFARANGIPVFSRHVPSEPLLQSFVEIVESPSAVLKRLRTLSVPPPAPAIRSFQRYYQEAAVARGYEKETADNCLLLMLEEFGELARALRKRANLTRESGREPEDPALELADIFIYIVHLANLLNLDLGDVVQKKELLNIERFLRRMGSQDVDELR